MAIGSFVKWQSSTFMAQVIRQISLLTRDRTWGNCMKLSHRSFRLGVSKRFFTQRVAKHWNRLPRKQSHYQACLSSRCLAHGGIAGESCAVPRIGLDDLDGSFPTQYILFTLKPGYCVLKNLSNCLLHNSNFFYERGNILKLSVINENMPFWITELLVCSSWSTDRQSASWGFAGALPFESQNISMKHYRHSAKFQI